MENADLVDTFWRGGGSSQNLGFIFMHLQVFFRLKVKNRDIFCGLPIFLFLGAGVGSGVG